ncbi:MULTISPECIES: hypothetical protein [Calothrix]|uniref:Uncharacterized protein n=2 Tax=Calothrix TaxID=1186 RepID=A0ABR8A5Y4_9CYAN|nr:MULTISPECIES: hypothetical protein [Calothrix]MBD2195346.1 hypothetical protein [Calothrix parietina FACHB-288]MBD2223945.1 hypothetical protein [Calothrix anomala FACHB-343]
MNRPSGSPVPHRDGSRQDGGWSHQERQVRQERERVIPFHFKSDTHRQAEGAEEAEEQRKRFVSVIW